MRVILKAMGKEPFPPARGPGSVDTVATEEQASALLCLPAYQLVSLVRSLRGCSHCW